MYRVTGISDFDFYEGHFSDIDDALENYHSELDRLAKMKCEWNICLVDLDSRAIVNQCVSDWFTTN